VIRDWTFCIDFLLIDVVIVIIVVRIYLFYFIVLKIGDFRLKILI